MAILDGEIWLTDSKANRLALEQIDLLQAILDTGSISAAAKAAGISYKTAWDRIERLNNLSKQPLVERASGGSKGGGTHLTAFGERLVQGFNELKQQHQVYLQGIGKQIQSLDDVAGFMKHTILQASARNQFVGTIRGFNTGIVNTDVILEIADSLSLVAQISEHSRQEMALQVGDTVLALIKASSVTLALDSDIQVSARNCFTGTVSRIEGGAVNTDISIDLGADKTISAMITSHSGERLALEVGGRVTAFFKASSVMLMRI